MSKSLRPCLFAAGLLSALGAGALILNASSSHAQDVPPSRSAPLPNASAREVAVSGRAFSTDPQKFSFAILGDRTGGGADNWPIADRAVAEINLMRPDLVISVGDLLPGYAAKASDGTPQDEARILGNQLAEYRRHLSPLQMPYYYVPGNHDIYNRNSYDFWRKNIGPTYYSFDYKGCHFMVLNTAERKGLAAPGETGKEGITPAQIEWVRRDLANAKPARHTFLFMHKPFFRDPGQPMQEWQQIEALLKDRPFTVFVGHVHILSQMQQRNGNRYFIIGTTGAQNGTRQSSTLMTNGRFQHYAMVNVENNDARVSIHEVGHVFPQDISDASGPALKKLNDLARVSLGPLQFAGDEATGTLTVKMQNVLTTPVKLRVSWLPGETAPWQIAPAASETLLQPGETKTQSFGARFDAAKFDAIPRYRLVATVNGQTVADKTEELDIGKRAPLVRSWQIIGPFDLNGADRSYPPEREIDLSKSYPGKPARGRKGAPQSVRWAPFTANSEGFVRPLFDPNGDDRNENNDFAVAYALTRVSAPQAMSVPAILSTIESDDGTRVFVNGQRVGEIEGGGARPNRKMLRLPLKAGENLVLVKTKERIGDWGFSLCLWDLREALKIEGPRDEAPLPDADEEEE